MATPQTEAAEVASLDNVLTKLAMTGEEKLERVLSKLLTRVISALGSPHEASRKKVMEILSHINKRIRNQDHIALPLSDLVDLFADPTTAGMVKNFALVYTEMAFDRAAPADREPVVAKMLAGISGRASNHQDMLLRMAVVGMETLAENRPAINEEEFRGRYPFLASDADRAVFLKFALQVMLQGPPCATVPVEEGAPKPPPAAMSRAHLARVLGTKPVAPPDALSRRKVALLNFTQLAGVPAREVYAHYQVAACDSQDRVNRRGEELAKKRLGQVDLEDTALMRPLFAMFLGTATNQAVAEDAKVMPAGVPLKGRMMGVFCKSIAAANLFPMTLQTVFACIYGVGSTMRLKQQGMEFTVWVFKHSSDEQLKPMGPVILSGLIKLLDEGEAAAAEGDSQVRALRGFTYQAVGQLAKRMPQLFSGNVDIAGRFFASLHSEPAGVRAAVQEAVSMLAAAYEGCSEQVGRELEVLLLEQIMSPQEPSRLCAVQWAARLFPFDHAPARYICMVGAGDKKYEIKEEAVKGLQPPKPAGKSGKAAEEAQKAVAYPSATVMLACAAGRAPKLLKPADPMEALLLEPKTMLALLEFVQECRRRDREAAPAEERADPAKVLPESYRLLVEHCLVSDATQALQGAALQALLEVAGEAPGVVADLYAPRMGFLRGFLGHVDSVSRDAAAKLVGVASRALAPGPAAEMLAEMVAAFRADEDKGRYEDRDGAVAAAGYVVAQGMTGTPAIPRAALESAARSLYAVLFTKTATLAATAASALGHAGLRGALPLPEGEPAPEEAEDKRDGAAKDSAVPEAERGEAHATRVRVARQMAHLTQEKDQKVVQAVAVASGHLASGDPTATVLGPILGALTKLARNKTEEVQFSVGEALAFLWGGVSATPDTVLYSGFISLAASAKFLTGIDASGDVEMTDAATVAHISEAEDTGPAGEARTKLLRALFDELLFSSRAEERCAASVWLLSLVSYTGRHPRLLPLLVDIQEAFSHLLGDPNELTQEMASRGMSIVYNIGDEATRKELVGELVGTLKGVAKKKRAVKVTSETRVFEEGAMGEVPGGGGVSTYKELCSIASDMGQPDLIYRFMELANHQSALNSRRGAAFGFASIAKQAGEQLGPHLATLVPKLYRMKYDPNPRIAESMEGIWSALVDDTRKTVDEHYPAVMKEVTREMGGRMWRSREGACTAMTDLLQSRRWDQVGAYFEEIWTMALRALDDIKETVRAAAALLCRTLSSLTIRMCDATLSPAADGEKCVAVVLPLLLSPKGVSSSVAEVRGLSVKTLMKIVKHAGSEQLRPQLGPLVVCMLESLSQLEDQRLNYVEQHAERAGISQEKLENMRVTASKSSPMADTLDMVVKHIGVDELKELMPKLQGLVRGGVGLNTRVGTARFINQVTMRLGADVRPLGGLLIKSMMTAVTSEKSPAVRRAFVATLAGVAKHAKLERMEQLVTDALHMVEDPGDTPARQLAGLILRELGRGAADAFSGQVSRVLPTAFILRLDAEKEVAGLWGDVWEENSGSKSAATRLYMNEVVPLCVSGLSSGQWGRKRQCARAASELAEGAGEDLAPHVPLLMSTMLAEIPGRIWDGKEDLCAAIGALCKGCPAAVAKPADVVAAVAAACGRKKASFRLAALACLEEVLAAFGPKDGKGAAAENAAAGAGGGDHFAAVAPMLLEACLRPPAPPSGTKDDKSNGAGAGGEAGSAGGEAGEEESAPMPIKEALGCLGAAWGGASAATAAARGGEVVAAVSAALAIEHPWATRAAALAAAKGFAASLLPEGEEGARGLAASAGAAASSGWIATLLPPVLANLGDAKISQVRQAALECVQVMVKLPGGLPSGAVDEIRGKLERLGDGDKSAAVRALALRMTESLGGAAPMSS